MGEGILPPLQHLIKDAKFTYWWLGKEFKNSRKKDWTAGLKTRCSPKFFKAKQATKQPYQPQMKHTSKNQRKSMTITGTHISEKLTK